MITNDFDTWLDGAPFLSINGSWEFDIWLDGVPMLEVDEGGTGVIRRRAFIF